MTDKTDGTLGLLFPHLLVFAVPAISSLFSLAVFVSIVVIVVIDGADERAADGRGHS
jgi:hypothetical protein